MKSFMIVGTLAGLCGAAQGGVIASTSFENAIAGDRYIDTGDASVDHDLVNNAGQSEVDFLSDGVEMGFDAYYRNTRDNVGLTDGDFVGATGYTGTVGSYTDGVQGYEMQDTDGVMGVSFDTVNFSGLWSMSVDLYVQTTGWESDDSIRVWVEVDGGTQVDLLNTIGGDVNDLGIEGSWMTLDLDLSSYSSGTLFVELDSNSGSESIYLDNVSFTTVPAPGSIALFGLGGLVCIRRNRA